MSEEIKEIIKDIEMKLDIFATLDRRLMTILIPTSYMKAVRDYISCYSTNFDFSPQKMLLTYKGIKVKFTDVPNTMIAI